MLGEPNHWRLVVNRESVQIVTMVLFYITICISVAPAPAQHRQSSYKLRNTWIPLTRALQKLVSSLFTNLCKKYTECCVGA